MPKTRENSSPKASKPNNAKAQPTQEEIALRAYHIYRERNGAPGNPFDDWTRAERELTEKPKKTRSKLGPKLVAA
jgi:Protein of unknown function (DUF2934)